MINRKYDYDPTNLDDIKTWTTSPNMKIGESIKKSVRQAIKDGGIKSVRDVDTNKSRGKEFTTKKGNKTYIEEYAKIDDQNKNRKKNNKSKVYLSEYKKLKKK